MKIGVAPHRPGLILTKMTLFQCLHIESENIKQKKNQWISFMLSSTFTPQVVHAKFRGVARQIKPALAHVIQKVGIEGEKKRERRKKMQMPDSPDNPKTTASNKDPHQKKKKGGSGRKKEKKSEEMRERETTPSSTPEHPMENDGSGQRVL